MSKQRCFLKINQVFNFPMRTDEHALAQTKAGAFLFLTGLSDLLGRRLSLWFTLQHARECRTVQRLWTAVVLPYFLGPTVAGLIMTGIMGGWAGFRRLRDRLFKWRVGPQWYAVALLSAPLAVTLLLVGFSLFSSIFLPGIITAADKITLLMTGIVTGVLFGGPMEELGWTGFAVACLRQGNSIMTTGLIVGVLHGLWHFPPKILISPTLGLTPFMAIDLLTAILNLTAWRILMVWIYERTDGSLLLTMLMHASLTGNTLFILALATGGQLVLYNLAVAAAAWLLVVAIITANKGSLEARK